MANLDAISHSVITNALDEIALEIEHAVVQTARNPAVGLAKDFSVGITDSKGDLINSTRGIAVHLGSIDMSVKAMKDAVDEIQNGDILLTNDPFEGGNLHMPDFTMVKPVFVPDSDEPVLWIILRFDQADIGAKDPIRSPTDTKSMYNEGLLIPPIKIVEEGRQNEDLTSLIARNSRLEEILRGDIQCMIGALRRGERRIHSLAEKYDANTIKESTTKLLSTTEKEVQEYIQNLPDGTYYGEDYLDSHPSTNEPVRIAVELTIDGSKLTFDFSDSDSQVDAPINNSIAATYSAVYTAWFTVADLDFPFNSGCVQNICIETEKGSIVDPEPPAATTYAPIDCGQETMQACILAFTDVVPENVSAGWSRWVRPLLSGRKPETDKEYRGLLVQAMGGSGAVSGQDGINAFGPLVALGGIVCDDPEMSEAVYPIFFDNLTLRTDSGGSGRWRGGLGPRIEVSPVNHEALFSLGGDLGQSNPPYGHLGGKSGEPTRVFTETSDQSDEITHSFTDIYLSSGETFILDAGGGGGVGDPYKREPKMVVQDVKNGYVSSKAAREEYGVILDPESNQIDPEATQELRERQSDNDRMKNRARGDN